MPAGLTAIWRYRHFILNSIQADYRSRLAGSRLGFLWIVVQPLAQALMFAVILSGVLQAKLPTVDIPGAYAIYLLSGIAAWGLFSEVIMRSTTMFLEHASVLKKIAFPRLCLPATVLGVALINHGFLVLSVLVICLALGHFISWPIIALLFVVPLTALLALSLGVILGVLNVFSRDIGQTMTIVIQLWFWATPIVYPASIVPEGFQLLLQINPMTHIVGAYQDIILMQAWPDLPSLVYPGALAMFASVFAIALFRRASSEVVDAL